MTTYNEAATKAQQELAPLLDEALTAARRKQANADSKLTDDEMRQQFIADLEKAARPDPQQAAEIIRQYTAQLPANHCTDGAFIIDVLRDLRRRNEINDEQAGKIVGALLLAMEGGVEAGLIVWPATPWQRLLPTRQLEDWHAWALPDAARKARERKARAAADYAHYSVEVSRLEAARQALGGIVPKEHKRSTRATVTNHGTRPVKSGPVRFTPGEPVELGADELAQVMDDGNFRQALDNGKIEVVR